MSRLRLRRLRIRVETAEGPFGTDVSFEEGLNILEARNSRGKTICTQAVLYALGMEAMLGPRHNVPLPDAMTDRLITPDGTEVAALESRIWLEIEGRDERLATLSRWAKHDSIDTKLVSVWDGPALSSPDTYTQHDHLVRAEGVLDREVGLHFFLSDLLGWELPEIIRTDGQEVPLYPEYVFALLFVEQRGGWRGLQALEPSFFIPEAKRRAVEFLLKLGVYDRARARIKLRQREQEIQQKWSNLIAEFKGGLRGSGLVPSSIPDRPVLQWPPEPEPGLIGVDSGDSLDIQVGETREALEAATAAIERPDVDADDELVAELEALEAEIPVLGGATAALRAEVAEEEATRAAVERTLERLATDLQRNKDARRLRDLGSEAWATTQHECPTCHRPLEEVVLPAGTKPVMSIDDNITFIEGESATFKLLRDESAQLHVIQRERLAVYEERLAEARSRLRELRSAVTSRRDAPSATLIGERIRLEARLRRLEQIELDLQRLLDDLAPLSVEAREVAEAMAQLPSEELTADEREKLNVLDRSVISQLEAYGFESIPPAELEISERSYHPARDGADVSLGISASDAIRMVWAYLLGLLEAARSLDTNHPGFVLFDEPRQQAADRPSLNAFLARAAESASFGQQVILATSEEPAELDAALQGVTHHLVHLGERVLQPVSD